MSQHTPGPWKRVGNSIKSKKADCVVVRLPALTGDEPAEQIERWAADARLIAAAPRLLEACRYAQAWADAHTREILLAAIAEAEGTEP